ncbi:MAG: hypothetical protein ACI9TP_001626, partial [Candidatus Azotimanducaceae bacterium]
MTDKPTLEPSTDNDEILFDINGESLCIYMSPAAERWLGTFDLPTMQTLFAEYPDVLQGFAQMVADGEVVDLVAAYGHRWELHPMFDHENNFAGALITVHVLPNQQVAIPDGAPLLATALLATSWQYDLAQDVLVLAPELKAALGIGAGPQSLAGLAQHTALVDALTQQIERLRTGGIELFSAEVTAGGPGGAVYNLLIRGQVCDRDADQKV